MNARNYNFRVAAAASSSAPTAVNRIVTILTPGLLACKTKPALATSADGIAVDQASEYPAIEVKTKVAPAAVAQMIALANLHGELVSVTVGVSPEQTARFCELVPQLTTRIQVIHHLAVCGVNYCLLVEADLNGIRRVVKVMVDAKTRTIHVDAVALLAAVYFDFVHDDTKMPNWPADTFGNRTGALISTLCGRQ